MFDAYDPIEEQALQYRAEKEAWDACQRAKKQQKAAARAIKQKERAQALDSTAAALCPPLKPTSQYVRTPGVRTARTSFSICTGRNMPNAHAAIVLF